MSDVDTRKIDWHLFIAAASIIITICTVVVGCYINLRSELTTIKTVLILKGIMPQSLAKQEGQNG